MKVKELIELLKQEDQETMVRSENLGVMKNLWRTNILFRQNSPGEEPKILRLGVDTDE